MGVSLQPLIVAPTLIARAVLYRLLGRPKMAREDVFAAQTLGIEDAAEEAESLLAEWKEGPRALQSAPLYNVNWHDVAPD